MSSKMRRLIVLVALFLLVVPVVYAQLCAVPRDFIPGELSGSPNLNSPPIGDNSCDPGVEEFTTGLQVHFPFAVRADQFVDLAFDVNYCEVGRIIIYLVDGTEVVVVDQAPLFSGHPELSGNLGAGGGAPFNRVFTLSMADLIADGLLNPDDEIKGIIYQVSGSGANEFQGLRANTLGLTFTDCNAPNMLPPEFCPIDTSCPALVCGDSFLNGDEQCDDGNILNGDGCNYACLSEATCGDGLCDAAAGENTLTCPQDCSPSPNIDVNAGLLAFGWFHNNFFVKVLDLLHIVKDALFQLEIKIIEIQLTNEPCSQRPVSFVLTTEFSPFGKLTEVRAVLALSIQGLDDAQNDGANVGSPNIAEAASNLAGGDAFLAAKDFDAAYTCYCDGYRNSLLNLGDPADCPV